MSKQSKTEHKIPQHEIDAIARCLLPTIQKFFEKEENAKAFEEWRQERLSYKKVRE